MVAQTVLIVDDEQSILDLLKYNLEKNGYEVLAGSNGNEAILLAR